jgi:twitching motility protein PilT
LVLSTLHTNDAKQTLDRILDAFPDAAQQIRMQLALLLGGVISQRLLRRADGMGLVPTMEILINTAHVTEIIEKGATREIEKAIAEGRHYQMQTFNQSLLDLVKTGMVTEEEALASSPSPEELRLGLRGVTKGSAAAGIDLDFGGLSPGGARTKPDGDSGGHKPKEDGKPKISRGFEF